MPAVWTSVNQGHFPKRRAIASCIWLGASVGIHESFVPALSTGKKDGAFLARGFVIGDTDVGCHGILLVDSVLFFEAELSLTWEPCKFNRLRIDRRSS